MLLKYRQNKALYNGRKAVFESKKNKNEVPRQDKITNALEEHENSNKLLKASDKTEKRSVAAKSIVRPYRFIGGGKKTKA